MTKFVTITNGTVKLTINLARIEVVTTSLSNDLVTISLIGGNVPIVVTHEQARPLLDVLQREPHA